MVDGGQPQVNAVAAVLSELGITDVALCGLAKRLEEVWLPGEDFPVILPRTSEALYLLQRIRDEAHRFAITFHRQRRSKRMTASALDGVPGLGETRRKALLRHFGSLKRLGHGHPGGDRRGAGHRPAYRRGGAGRAQSAGSRTAGRAGWTGGGTARRGGQDQGRREPVRHRSARAGVGQGVRGRGRDGRRPGAPLSSGPMRRMAEQDLGSGQGVRRSWRGGSA